ncbi:histidine kinase [Flavobacterium cupreum]|uniref:Histidine kinase n=2 Tax=Flavobacterium TaxID=237 RepID=A0A434A2M8_9FLAO|nr:histidine kinase [Flavobacterium cupreum]RUT68575.1 histidine kinase [Flavobacterium cupreum]
MKNRIESYYEIAKNLKKEYPKLSEFEILSLAVQIERNQILENGLAVSFEDKYPSALEGISIALGFKNNQLDTTITNVLQEIADQHK